MYKMLMSLRSLKLFGLCPRWPRRLMISVFNKQKESLCLIYRIESEYLLSVSQHIARGYTPFKIVSPLFVFEKKVCNSNERIAIMHLTISNANKKSDMWHPTFHWWVNWNVGSVHILGIGSHSKDLNPPLEGSDQWITCMHPPQTEPPPRRSDLIIMDQP